MVSSLLVVSTAYAAPPSVGFSTCPGSIRIVQSTASGPDVTDGLFTVVVKDASNVPINGSRVTVSFCGAADLRICQDQQNAVYTVDCAAGTVSALTDTQGQVDFTILGGSINVQNGTSVRGTVKISADDPVNHQSVLLSDTSPTTGLVCAAPDEDGTGGLAAHDFSLFASDLGTQWQRSDFDGDGDVDTADQSILQNIFLSARMTVSCPAYCASCATPTRVETWGSVKLIYR